MSCTVTPNVVCGTVNEDEADRFGVGLALQGDASACQFGLGVVEVVDLNPEMADHRSLAILEPRHAETRMADLDQLQGRFAGHQNLQVDVVGDKTLANGSAVNGVARPSDGFVDIAHDDSDVIQPK